MPSTSTYLLPYPSLTAAPNVPADVQALADRMEIVATALAAATTAKPSGKLSGGYAEATSTQSGITTPTDITSVTATVTVATGRRIKITVRGLASSTVVGDRVLLTIQEGATVLCSSYTLVSPSGVQNASISAEVVLTPTAGAHTYKATIDRTSGTGSVSVNGAISPTFILVEDIGI